MNFSDVRIYVKGLLTKSFANKTVLDKLSEDNNGNINYNGNPIQAAQDSYSKEEIDEIVKNDYKQIFDKNSNVELLDAPVSFTADKASTIGNAVVTNINQSFTLNQSIESFDYLIFAIRPITIKDKYTNTPERRLVLVKDIIYNSTEIANDYDKSIGCLAFDMGTSSTKAYGAYTLTLYYWFKNNTEIFVQILINPMVKDLEFCIDSIIGTKFHSTEIYKETSVLNTPTNYSLEERCIGSWIDGKPLYQKTINCGNLPNNSSNNYPINVSNLDLIIFISGIAIGSVTLPLPNVHQITMSNQISIYHSNDNIVIATATDYSQYIGYITIQYTKTTD